MNKIIGFICIILLLTKSDIIFANETLVFDFSNRELLHYLLFDLIFIVSVWLFFYLCKIVMTRSKQKESKSFSIYSQRHFEPSLKNSKTPII